MPRRLILASSSPRRHELLTLLGLPFAVHPSHVDEDQILGEGGIEHNPGGLAEQLAYEKAWDLYNQVRFGEIEAADQNLIIAADTIVTSDREGVPRILGKPTDADDARYMLRLLSGTTHTVYTGVCVMECDWNEDDVDWIPMWNTRVSGTHVTFRDLTPPMIDAYLATGEPFDKAGAYGIQGFASAFVDTIHGDYFNVVGLPVNMLARMLENIGIEWWRGAVALD